jgi:hypothetical protein
MRLSPSEIAPVFRLPSMQPRWRRDLCNVQAREKLQDTEMRPPPFLAGKSPCLSRGILCSFYSLPPIGACRAQLQAPVARPMWPGDFLPRNVSIFTEETERTEEIAKDGLPAHRVERQRGCQPRCRGAQARLHPAERRQMTPRISRMGADYRPSGEKLSACAGRGHPRRSSPFSLNHRAYSAAPNNAFHPSETVFSPLSSLPRLLFTKKFLPS